MYNLSLSEEIYTLFFLWVVFGPAVCCDAELHLQIGVGGNLLTPNLLAVILFCT